MPLCELYSHLVELWRKDQKKNDAIISTVIVDDLSRVVVGEELRPDETHGGSIAILFLGGKSFRGRRQLMSDSHKTT